MQLFLFSELFCGHVHLEDEKATLPKFINSLAWHAGKQTEPTAPATRCVVVWKSWTGLERYIQFHADILVGLLSVKAVFFVAYAMLCIQNKVRHIQSFFALALFAECFSLPACIHTHLTALARSAPRNE